uniref:Uncharacterized protein n=1 Tax=Nymphaea colorata TaxID=210225 RepID=A0A5K1DQ82_9MAGN
MIFNRHVPDQRHTK